MTVTGNWACFVAAGALGATAFLSAYENDEVARGLLLSSIIYL